MKITAFVVARLNSARLPEKHLRKIGNKILLKWITDRLKTSKFINEIVITTLDEPGSEKLIEFSKKEKIKIFLYGGETDNVVGRLVSAANYFNSEICVLISGDCPLISIETLDKMIKALINNEKKCAGVGSKNGKHVIHEGMGCVCKKEAWIKADEMSKSPELREHHFPIIHRNPEIFPKVIIDDDEIFYTLNHRISVDTPADLKFMNVIFDKLKKEGKEFNLKNAIKLLNKKPEILEINSNVKQKGLFDKSKKYLFCVTAGDIYGFGNLFRSLHLADLITRKGHGVTFAVKYKEVESLIKKSGFKCIVDKNYLKDEFDKYEKIVFDINSNINLNFEIPENSIVIDNLNKFSENAETIIVPTTYCNSKKKNVLKNLIIIRGQVKTVKLSNTEKLYDALFYKEKLNIKSFSKVKFVEKYNDNFLNLMAESKYFFAPFGYSFYEAIYLGTIPVMTNESKDGKLFYKSLGLPVLTKDNFYEVQLPEIKDSSEEIVNIILK